MNTTHDEYECEQRPLLGFDTETHLIDQKAQLPKLVCLSMFSLQGHLIASDTPDELRKQVAEIVHDTDCLKINQSIAFDLAVFAMNYPDLFPAIFKALDDGQFSCIQIREKLLNLATTGDLEFLELGGSKTPIKYNLAALEARYLGIDRSEEKKDKDAWRMNYGLLDGVPLAQWPEGAKTYPLDDAKNPVLIWQEQEEKRLELIRTRGIDPFKTEKFRVMVDFCLRICASRGVATDKARVAEVEAMLAKELAPEKMDLLVSNGILRPATPPRPYKNGATEQCTRCGGRGEITHGEPDDPMPYVGDCNECSGKGIVPKLAEGKPESIDKKSLTAYVTSWAALESIKLDYTDPSDKFPDGQVSVTSDFLAKHAHLMDPTLKQYQHRQKLQKLVTTEIPRMKLNDVVQDCVYPQYDPLKETGRVSSFASKPTADKPATAATFNCQNVDPRVRGCYVARPGTVMWSCDYSQMELGTLAQVCFGLFGYSVLRDKINAGVDVHAYTGAQLAFAKDPEFQKVAITHFGNPTQENNAELLLWLKTQPDTSEDFKFYKHWRKFAKPVNLGLPGGLGAPTFVTYAASEQYGVAVTEDEAKDFKKIWLETYPEMREYFQYINRQCIDPHNKGWSEEDKEEYAKYAYTSPYGMYRAGCDYCACANGLGLQTPSADGALTSLIMLVEACFVPGVNAILGPAQGQTWLDAEVWPLMFVHDEHLGEMNNTGPAAEKVHARCMEIKRIMIEAMARVTPDVKPNANVCLMRRWDKAAEPVFDASGSIQVWTPNPK